MSIKIYQANRCNASISFAPVDHNYCKLRNSIQQLLAVFQLELIAICVNYRFQIPAAVVSAQKHVSGRRFRRRFRRFRRCRGPAREASGAIAPIIYPMEALFFRFEVGWFGRGWTGNPEGKSLKRIH